MFQYLAVQAWKPKDETYLEKTGQLRMNPVLTKETLKLYRKFSDEKSSKLVRKSISFVCHLDLYPALSLTKCLIEICSNISWTDKRKAELMNQMLMYFTFHVSYKSQMTLEANEIK